MRSKPLLLRTVQLALPAGRLCKLLVLSFKLRALATPPVQLVPPARRTTLCQLPLVPEQCGLTSTI